MIRPERNNNEMEFSLDLCTVEIDGILADGCVPEHEAIQQIVALQQMDFCRINPIAFKFDGHVSNTIIDTLCQTIESFASRGIQWKELHLVFRTGLEIARHRLCDALRVAHRESLFECIKFEDLRTGITPGDLQLFPSLERNHRLKKLELSGIHLSAKDLASLALMLRQSTSLRMLCISKCEMVNHQDVCRALAANSSMNEAIVSLDDGCLHPILRSLIGHRSLQNLFVGYCNKTGVLEVVSEIVSSSDCCLKKLVLGSSPWYQMTNAGPLVQAIRDNNTTLSALDIRFRMSGTRPFSNLLHVWKSHPKLRRLWLNQPFSAQDIQEAKGGPRFRQRVYLHNRFFHFTKPNSQNTPAIKEFFDVHPEICFPGSSCDVGIDYAGFLNNMGRYLMYQDIPVGLWPLVLARIEEPRKSPTYKCSAVYEFLHGPAFAGRPTTVEFESGKKRSWEAI